MAFTRTTRLAPLLLLPALLLILVFDVAPFLYGVGMGLFRFRLAEPGPRVFVGLENVRFEVTQDPLFWPAFWRSVEWVLLANVGAFAVGLALALFLHREFRGRGLARALTWLPWATPVITSAVVWRLLYEPNFGFLASLLKSLNLPAVRWLGDPALAFYSALAVQVWRWIPFFSITLLAGLQAIPRELYEAAAVDGASPRRQFLSITLPLLRGTVSLALLIGAIWGFKAFTLIYSMTEGGPANSSHVLGTITYQLAFRYGHLDRAAVIGTAMALILLGIGAVWIRVELRRRAV